MHHHWQHDLGAHSEWQGDSGWRWWPLGQATTNSPGRIVLRGLNCPVCRAGWWHLAYNWQFLLSLPFWRHNKESHTEIRLLHTHVKWPKNRYKKKKKKKKYFHSTVWPWEHRWGWWPDNSGWAEVSGFQSASHSLYFNYPIHRSNVKKRAAPTKPCLHVK